MSDYLQIYYGASTAAPKAVEWDRSMIVGDGSDGSIIESTLYELSSSNWSTQLEDDGFAIGDTLYDSVSIFFSATPIPQRLWAYAYMTGAVTTYDDVPLEYVTGNIWRTPIRPPTAWKPTEDSQVKYFGYGEDIGTGYVVNKSDGSEGIGFTITEDAAGDWDGYLEFPNGLTGEAGIDNPVPSNGKITVSYTAGSNANIGEVISEYRINMVSLALDNNSTLKNYSDNVFGSQLDDLIVMLSAISGKICRFIYALPGDAQPDEIITGTASRWKELKALLGANEHFSPLKVIHSALNHDVASGYMAQIAVSHPHKQIGFLEPHFGILSQEQSVNRGKWKDGQIACIMKRTQLAGDPFLVTYGFTFGSGDVSRIEGSRCRDIMAQTLENNLWGLLAERDTLMSYEGMQKIKARIRATFNTLISQGIMDGLESIYIPIEEDLVNNTVAGQLARSLNTVPAVEVEYKWYTSVEKIIITSAENIAT